MTSSQLAFNGERFVPECSGEIAYEHWHRYAFAAALARDKIVLDVASGEGYGTALLAEHASSAVGVDISNAAVIHSAKKYQDRRILGFVQASCTALPFASHTFDLIVSFETIEHVDEIQQRLMIEEFSRVLKPDGLLLISSPNKRLYSDARDYSNEYHVRELYDDEFRDLLSRQFPMQRWFHQRLQLWSVLWSTSFRDDGVDAWIQRHGCVTPYSYPDALYYVVLAARQSILSIRMPRVSLFADEEESVLERYEGNTREMIRLQKLVDEFSAAADRQTGHIKHLEYLVAERERIIQQRDRDLKNRDETIQRADDVLNEKCLEISTFARTIEEQQQHKSMLEEELRALRFVVRSRESWRWAITLPWLLMRRVIAQRRDTEER